MASIVLVDAHAGKLDRFEMGGQAFRRTHGAQTEEHPYEFTAAVVEEFRVNPPEWARVEPTPEPTGPTCGAGTVRKAA